MLFSPASTPPPHPPPVHTDSRVLEPDDQWKADLRKRIEHDLRHMVEEAQTVRDAILNSQLPESSREHVQREFEERMNDIRALAQEQYNTQLYLEMTEHKEVEAKIPEEERLLRKRVDQHKEWVRWVPRTVEWEPQNKMNASFDPWTPNRPSSTTGSAGNRSKGSFSTTPRPSQKIARPGSPGLSLYATKSDEAEWVRRAEERERQQREQERLESKRQAKKTKVLSREELIKLYENHENKWKDLMDIDNLYLRWNNFAWPTFEHPSEPEDMTTSAISTYVLSKYAPDAHAKDHKDRIKDHLKRWNSYTFEVWIFPRVVEEERQKVMAGVTVVIRGLFEMYTNVPSGEEPLRSNNRPGAPGLSPYAAGSFEGSTRQAEASARIRDAAAQNEADVERREDETENGEAKSQMHKAKVFPQETEAQRKEARRLMERARPSLEEAGRHVKIGETPAQKKEVEATRKEAEAKKREAEALGRETKAQIRKTMIEQKEEEVNHREDEARRLEEKAQQALESARQVEASAKLREAEAKKLKAEVQRREAEVRRKDEEVSKREKQAHFEKAETQKLEERLQKIERHIQSREAEIEQMLRTIEERTRAINLREDDLRHKLAAVREQEEKLQLREAELQEMEAETNRYGHGANRDADLFSLSSRISNNTVRLNYDGAFKSNEKWKDWGNYGNEG